MDLKTLWNKLRRPTTEAERKMRLRLQLIDTGLKFRHLRSLGVLRDEEVIKRSLYLLIQFRRRSRYPDKRFQSEYAGA